MKISDLGEFGLIHAIRKLSARRSDDVVIGIGDDAAALRSSPAALLLATTDMLIEGVHFDLSYTDFYSLGWKSAAVNLSDIAAMGGIPRFCLTSLAIPPHISVEQITEFYRGFNALLRTHKTILAGGDTCSSLSGLVISVTVLGEAKRKKVLPRSGARRGDKIFVTGTLGDSAAGMEFLRLRNSRGRTTRNKSPNIQTLKSPIAELVEKHLRPVPRVEWGKTIALAGCASAMIDISDGLSSDLIHLCEESGVGAHLFPDAVPLSESLQKSSSQLSEPPLHYALSGGEDYELLFTVPPARMKALESLNIPVAEIGVITTGKKTYLVDSAGDKTSLRPTGYNHFKGTGIARNAQCRSSA